MRRLVFTFYLLAAFTCSLLIATNVFAELLHDPAVLGTRHFLGDFYGPFAILKWFWSIRVPGHRYTEAFLVFLVSFATLGAVGYRLYVRLKVNLVGLYGSARWMTEGELRRSGALNCEGIILGQTHRAGYARIRTRARIGGDEAGSRTYASPPGYAQTGGTADARAHEPIAMPGGYRYRMWRRGRLIFSRVGGHVLVIAPTGGGKNVSVVAPTLLSWLGSAVVYDVKNENFTITSGFRRSFSYLYRFEPANPEHSVHFNPLFEIEKGEKEVAQVQNLAEILINPHGDGEYASREDAHWKLTAKQLLVGAILHVLYSSECEDKSLRGVYGLLNDPDRPIRDTLSHMNDANHLNPDFDPWGRRGTQVRPGGAPNVAITHPVVAEAARNMLNKADNELSGVVSTASSYLQLYQDPIVAENTRSSDFRISDLTRRPHPCTLYLCVSPRDAQRMQPLVRLVLQMIAGRLTESLGANAHPMLLLLDEFPTLGKMSFFENQLAFFRGYNVRVMMVAQSFHQLFGAYGTSTSIVDNCAEIAVLGIGHQDAKVVSGFLGSNSLNRENQSRSASIGSFFEWTHTRSHSEAGRPLMTTDELTRMSYDEFLLIAHGSHPYKGKKIMYYQDPRFTSRANGETISTREEQRLELGAPAATGWVTGPDGSHRQAVMAPESAIVVGRAVPVAALGSNRQEGERDDAVSPTTNENAAGKWPARSDRRLDRRPSRRVADLLQQSDRRKETPYVEEKSLPLVNEEFPP